MTPAATARSSLDLLTLSYPFSQVHLLPPSAFAEEADKRRTFARRGYPSFNANLLQTLHRHGVLVPMLRVEMSGEDPQRAIDTSRSLTAAHATTTIQIELMRAAIEGRVSDPDADAIFQDWPQVPRYTPWPSADGGYLYSRHQLLGLDAAADVVEHLEPRRDPNGDIVWSLDEVHRPHERGRQTVRSWRALAVTLTALDTYYWPRITNALRNDPVVWREALVEFDATAMMTWLGLTLDNIVNQATQLRVMASGRDDLGDFYDLVRRAKADAWDSLRGDALSAMDYRLAADILDRYADEVAPARPTYTPPLSQQGLRDRPESLDSALTHLRLSPHPALVLAIEGDTEYRLIPRVMDTLGIRKDRNFIRIVEFDGTKDLHVLARYTAEPVLGTDYGRGVTLDQPFTRFLVLTDAENKYRDARERQRQRRELLKAITKNVPADLQRDLFSYGLRARTVEIRTWGKLPFEFAHFSDAQLADAMLCIANVPHPRGRAALINALHMQRTHDPSPNVDDVRWRGSGLSKKKLADALWPSLEARIKRAASRGQKGPPIMRNVLRAYEMAVTSFGTPVILRRHPQSKT